jgi:hypothetical protein
LALREIRRVRSPPESPTLAEKRSDAHEAELSLAGRGLLGFILLHQTDCLLISPLTSSIMEEFQLSKTQMGLVTSMALLVGGLLPLVGITYDTTRPPISLALSFSATTWLSAIAPTIDVSRRASTGIMTQLSGITVISDSAHRCKVPTGCKLPSGYLLASAWLWASARWWLAQSVLPHRFDRDVVAALIFFLVRDVPRGGSEPELEGREVISPHRFELRKAVELFRKRSLMFLFGQGFVGVFPWNVITFWFFAYLETERGYDSNAILLTMAPAVLYSPIPVGGSLGSASAAHARTPSVSMVGVLMGVSLTFTYGASTTVRRSRCSCWRRQHPFAHRMWCLRSTSPFPRFAARPWRCNTSLRMQGRPWRRSWRASSPITRRWSTPFW